MEAREKKVMHSFRFILAFAQIASTAMLAGAETRLATVNNADMIIMQKLSKEFEQQHPDIKLDWVVLEENVLRERTTTDIATKGGSSTFLRSGPMRRRSGESEGGFCVKTKVCLRVFKRACDN
jgi:hypothetical protein